MCVFEGIALTGKFIPYIDTLFSIRVCVSGVSGLWGLRFLLPPQVSGIKLRLSGFCGRALTCLAISLGQFFKSCCVCLSVSVGLEVRRQLLGVRFLLPLWFYVSISGHQLCEARDLPTGPAH